MRRNDPRVNYYFCQAENGYIQ